MSIYLYKYSIKLCFLKGAVELLEEQNKIALFFVKRN